MTDGVDPYNFNQIIDRSGTSSTKYDDRLSIFGQTDVIPAWVADMDFSAPPAVTQALIERASHPIYGYTLFPNSLYESAINWMQRRHNWEIKRDWIVMCPGVVPSLNAAVMAFSQPDEAVIVQPPVYFPFFSAVTQTGRKLVENPLKYNNGRYTIDFDHLDHCAKTARLMLLCSPHNPVGRVWSIHELEQLLHIAKKHELIILSDEIHADLIYPEHQHTVLATLQDSNNHVITAVTPSKTFNIPGLNLSMLVIPNPTTRNAITSIFDTWHVSASNPFSITAFEAAYREGETWLDALRVYLRDTRDYVAAFLAKYLPHIHMTPSEGTYLLWLDCTAMKMTDDVLERFFVEEAGVGLSPGVLFGKPGSGFMRLNIGAPRETIVQILERIRAAYNLRIS